MKNVGADCRCGNYSIETMNKVAAQASEVHSALLVGVERGRVVDWLRAPNEDGTPCSLEREILAQRLARGDHLK